MKRLTWLLALVLPLSAFAPNDIYDELRSDRVQDRSNALLMVELGIATGDPLPQEKVIPALLHAFRRRAEEGTKAGKAQATAARMLRLLGKDSPLVANAFLQASLSWAEDDSPFVTDALNETTTYFEKPTKKVLESLREHLLVNPTMREAKGLIALLAERDREFPKYAQKVLDASWKNVQSPVSGETRVGFDDEWTHFLEVALETGKHGAKSTVAADRIRALMTEGSQPHMLLNSEYFHLALAALREIDGSSNETKEALRRAEGLARSLGATEVRDELVREIGFLRSGKRLEIAAPAVARQKLEAIIAAAKDPGDGPDFFRLAFPSSVIAREIEAIDPEDRALYLRRTLSALRGSPSPTARRVGVGLVRRLWHSQVPEMRDTMNLVERCRKIVRQLQTRGKLELPRSQ